MVDSRAFRERVSVCVCTCIHVGEKGPGTRKQFMFICGPIVLCVVVFSILAFEQTVVVLTFPFMV